MDSNQFRNFVASSLRSATTKSVVGLSSVATCSYPIRLPLHPRIHTQLPNGGASWHKVVTLLALNHPVEAGKLDVFAGGHVEFGDATCGGSYQSRDPTG